MTHDNRAAMLSRTLGGEGTRMISTAHKLAKSHRDYKSRFLKAQYSHFVIGY